MSTYTYSLLINLTWSCMYQGGVFEARQHKKQVNAVEARLYKNGRYVGVVD